MGLFYKRFLKINIHILHLVFLEMHNFIRDAQFHAYQK